jgi:hypothetical protein
MNQRAINAAVLPCVFNCPLASEQVVTNPAVSQSGGTQYPLVLTVPSKSIMEGMPFDLLISGVLVQPGATPTVGFNLYSGNSMTVANNTLLKAIAAGAVGNGGKEPFYIKGTFQADSISNLLTGTVKALIGTVLDAEAAITPVAIPGFGSDPVVSLLLSVIPTVANAGNYLKLFEFAVNF